MTAREVVLDGGSPWGFRLHGGADVHQPLRISRVNPGSKAALRGIREGDLITSINNQSTRNITNSEAHALLKNSGDFLKLGLNEDTNTTPKRRQYKTVHEETHSESVKKSSVTSYIVTSEIVSDCNNDTKTSNGTSESQKSTLSSSTSSQEPDSGMDKKRRRRNRRRRHVEEYTVESPKHSPEKKLVKSRSLDDDSVTIQEIVEEGKSGVTEEELLMSPEEEENLRNFLGSLHLINSPEDSFKQTEDVRSRRAKKREALERYFQHQRFLDVISEETSDSECLTHHLKQGTPELDIPVKVKREDSPAVLRTVKLESLVPEVVFLEDSSEEDEVVSENGEDEEVEAASCSTVIITEEKQVKNVKNENALRRKEFFKSLTEEGKEATLVKPIASAEFYFNNNNNQKESENKNLVAHTEEKLENTKLEQEIETQKLNKEEYNKDSDIEEAKRKRIVFIKLEEDVKTLPISVSENAEESLISEAFKEEEHLNNIDPAARSEEKENKTEAEIKSSIEIDVKEKNTSEENPVEIELPKLEVIEKQKPQNGETLKDLKKEIAIKREEFFSTIQMPDNVETERTQEDKKDSKYIDESSKTECDYLEPGLTTTSKVTENIKKEENTQTIEDHVKDDPIIEEKTNYDKESIKETEKKTTQHETVFQTVPIAIEAKEENTQLQNDFIKKVPIILEEKNHDRKSTKEIENKKSKDVHIREVTKIVEAQYDHIKEEEKKSFYNETTSRSVPIAIEKTQSKESEVKEVPITLAPYETSSKTADILHRKEEKKESKESFSKIQVSNQKLSGETKSRIIPISIELKEEKKEETKNIYSTLKGTNLVEKNKKEILSEIPTSFETSFKSNIAQNTKNEFLNLQVEREEQKIESVSKINVTKKKTEPEEFSRIIPVLLDYNKKDKIKEQDIPIKAEAKQTSEKDVNAEPQKKMENNTRYIHIKLESDQNKAKLKSEDNKTSTTRYIPIKIEKSPTETYFPFEEETQSKEETTKSADECKTNTLKETKQIFREEEIKKVKKEETIIPIQIEAKREKQCEENYDSKTKYIPIKLETSPSETYFPFDKEDKMDCEEQTRESHFKEQSCKTETRQEKTDIKENQKIFTTETEMKKNKTEESVRYIPITIEPKEKKEIKQEVTKTKDKVFLENKAEKTIEDINASPKTKYIPIKIEKTPSETYFPFENEKKQEVKSDFETSEKNVEKDTLTEARKEIRETIDFITNEKLKTIERRTDDAKFPIKTKIEKINQTSEDSKTTYIPIKIEKTPPETYFPFESMKEDKDKKEKTKFVEDLGERKNDTVLSTKKDDRKFTRTEDNKMSEFKCQQEIQKEMSQHEKKSFIEYSTKKIQSNFGKENEIEQKLKEERIYENLRKVDDTNKTKYIPIRIETEETATTNQKSNTKEDNLKKKCEQEMNQHEKTTFIEFSTKKIQSNCQKKNETEQKLKEKIYENLKKVEDTNKTKYIPITIETEEATTSDQKSYTKEDNLRKRIEHFFAETTSQRFNKLEGTIPKEESSEVSTNKIRTIPIQIEDKNQNGKNQNEEMKTFIEDQTCKKTTKAEKDFLNLESQSEIWKKICTEPSTSKPSSKEPTPNSISSGSTGSKLTIRYNSLSDLTLEVSSLRDLCVSYLLKQPFGLTILQELSNLSSEMLPEYHSINKPSRPDLLARIRENARLKARDLGEWLKGTRRGELDRLYDLQREILEQQEREIRRELEMLEEERNKFRIEDFHISSRGDFAEKKSRPVSLPPEFFRQQMYEEYMDKFAQREERKENKIMKISLQKNVVSKSMDNLQEEFMNKVKQKQKLGKLGKESSEDEEEDKIPQHLKEFMDFGVWSPGQKPSPISDPSPHQSVDKNDPISPIWTPKSATSSPTSDRKEFRPIKYESPVLSRKTYKSQDTAPPWKLPDSSSDTGINLSSTLEKRLPTSHSSPDFPKSLPKAQNPTITLLQKAREGQLPKGALYIEEQRRNQDEKAMVGPGEILYKIKNEYISDSDSEKPRKMADLGPRQYEGIGPTTKDGMPLILRSEVKDANQSKWYKKMYDTIHKQRPHRDEFVTVKYRQKRGQYPYSSGYLSEPEPANYDSDTVDYKYATLDRRRLRENDMDSVIRHGHNQYKNQPGRIENYIPGHSSISEKEAKEWWDEVMDIFDGWLDDNSALPSYDYMFKRALAKSHLEQQRRVPQTKSFINQALKESGYESDSTLVFRRREEAQQLSPKEQKEAYKIIQKGGDVPLHGLRKPAPERPKELEYFPISPTLTRIRIHKNIKPQKEILCYPVTIHPHPSTVLERVKKAPSPPKRKSSRNNTTLRMISTIKPTCKRHETCFATDNNVKILRDKLSSRFKPKPEVKRVITTLSTCKDQKTTTSTIKTRTNLIRSNEKCASTPQKKTKVGTTLKKTSVKNNTPITEKGKTILRTKKTKPESKTKKTQPKIKKPEKIQDIPVKTYQPQKPTISAMKVYLKHTKPVTDSKFRSLDLARSRSASPKSLTFEPEKRSISLPPKLVFSQTSRPVSPEKVPRSPCSRKIAQLRPVSIYSSIESIDRKEYQNYVKELLRSSPKSSKFKDLNDFYTAIEKFGKLQQNTMLKPRGFLEDEIIDYDRWKEVRTREKAEKELKDLVEQLKHDAKEKGFFFASKESQRWRKEYDRGLRIKEKSVDNIREEFEKFHESRPMVSPKDTYKPLWRGDSVLSLANKMVERRTQSEGRNRKLETERLLTHGIGSRLWSSLSSEQVNILKNQLSEIYSHNVKKYEIEVPKQKTYSSPLTVRRNSDTIKKDLSETEKKTISQNLSKEFLDLISKRKVILAKETRGAILAAQAMPKPEEPFHKIQKYNETESSTDDSVETVIQNEDIRKKVEYFENVGDEKFCPTIYKAGEEGSQSCQDLKELFGETELKKLTTIPLSATRKEVYVSPERPRIPEARSGSPVKSKLVPEARSKLCKSPEAKTRPKTILARSPERSEAKNKPKKTSGSPERLKSLPRTRSPIVEAKNKIWTSPQRPKSIPESKICLERPRSISEDAKPHSPIISGSVRRLKNKFEPLSRSFSDPTLYKIDVDSLRNQYEYPKIVGRGRSRYRRGGVVSPTFLRAEDRFMPHINIISKIADLYTRQRKETERTCSMEELAKILGCPVGEVEKLRQKFDSVSLLGHMFTSSPNLKELRDIAPYLAASWFAHRFPKTEDNYRSLPDCKRPKSSSPIKSPSSILKEERQRWMRWIHTKPSVSFKETEPPPPPPKGLHGRSLQESPRKYVENEVTIHYKTPVRQEIKECISEDELAYRQAEAMKKIYEEEKRRKYLQVSNSLQELQDMTNRRHTDNFIPSQKSPIALNRYDDFDDLAPPPVKPRPRSPEPRLMARALYNFVGQTARELTFRKGDIIHVRRQVDKNWYEGELNAMVGLFPVNYVEIITYDTAKPTPRKTYEGQARARYNFVAQTHLELSLAKGELVVITRRVDDNWFEGKIGGRKGIFPVSYVDVLIDPSSPPAPSTKPVASPAAHSLLLNGSSGGKESMGSHSYTPNIAANQLTTSYQAKPGKVGQALHIETQAEPIPYRALYKYLPQNDDELELLEGDTVYVLEKCDDGWYVGSSERTGAFGTFPGNYVEKV